MHTHLRLASRVDVGLQLSTKAMVLHRDRGEASDNSDHFKPYCDVTGGQAVTVYTGKGLTRALERIATKFTGWVSVSLVPIKEKEVSVPFFQTHTRI